MDRIMEMKDVELLALGSVSDDTKGSPVGHIPDFEGQLKADTGIVED